MRDHTYCSKDTSLSQPTHSQLKTLQEEVLSEIQVLLDSASTPVFTKEDLNISLEERERIGENTREQAQSPLWHLVSKRRITTSVWENNLSKANDISFVDICLVSKTL